MRVILPDGGPRRRGRCAGVSRSDLGVHPPPRGRVATAVRRPYCGATLRQRLRQTLLVGGGRSRSDGPDAEVAAGRAVRSHGPGAPRRGVDPVLGSVPHRPLRPPGRPRARPGGRAGDRPTGGAPRTGRCGGSGARSGAVSARAAAGGGPGRAAGVRAARLPGGPRGRGRGGRLGRVLAPTRPARHPGGAGVRSRDRGLRAPPGTPRRMVAGGRGGRGRGGPAGLGGGRLRGGGTGTARADPDGNTGAAGTRGGRRARRAQTAGPAPARHVHPGAGLGRRTARPDPARPGIGSPAGRDLPACAGPAGRMAGHRRARGLQPRVVVGDGGTAGGGLVIALVRRPERHYRRRLWASSGPLVAGAAR